MNRAPSPALVAAFVAALLLVAFASFAAARADGRAGTVEYSDGRALTGAVSLAPGKELRVFTGAAPVSVSLDTVKEIRFTVEKDEMREGFYFPNAGQATQAKTGDVYPVRYLAVVVTLADGTVVSGHLISTTLYVDGGDTVEKVVLLGKLTGQTGQKPGDIVYPARVRFDAGGAGAAAGAVQIDLTQSGFVPTKSPVVLARPALTLLPASRSGDKLVWTVPAASPGAVLFAVEAADGIHVAWPAEPVPPDPELARMVSAALAGMHDFYDTRTLLGCFRDGDEVGALVMLKRTGAVYEFSADKTPWSLVALHGNYDAAARKVALLDRTLIALGRAQDNSPPPAVLKQPELLRTISAAAPAPAGSPTP
ncbi:MAG: hypothetical protein WDO13_07405 [Verrucomicrobiota bacterium]